MLLIALIHTAWLLLFPAGLVLATRGAFKKRRAGLLIGSLLVLLSLPAVAFCKALWPPDFFLLGSETRLTLPAGKYALSLVQQPGTDFYDSFFEVTRPDGKVTRIMIDGDDDKWWFPRAVTRGGRTYFVSRAKDIGSRTPYLDFSTGTFYSGHDSLHSLSELDFEKRWN